MSELHALALLAQSTKLRPAPLSSTDQNLYLDLLKKFKRVIPKTKTNKTLYEEKLPTKPFTGPQFIIFVNKTASAAMKKKWGNVSAQSKSPKIWGPLMWRFLHWMSACFVPAKKADFMSFLTLVGKTLPCSECSAHFLAILQRKEVLKAKEAVKSVHGFANFVIQLHVLVNKNTSPKNFLTYKSVPGTLRSSDAVRYFLRRQSYYQTSSKAAAISAIAAKHRPSGSIVNLNQQIKARQPKSSCGCSGR